MTVTTPRPGRVPRHLLSRARARVCQAQGHLPSPSFPAAASAQCASYCCLETILGVDAGHYSERSEDGAHINFTLLAAGRVMEGGGMTGHHQRSSTSVVPDQFSQWSNTFSHRAACRLQTAALQHTAWKPDRHISVHWSSVWSQGSAPAAPLAPLLPVCDVCLGLV